MINTDMEHIYYLAKKHAYWVDTHLLPLKSTKPPRHVWENPAAKDDVGILQRKFCTLCHLSVIIYIPFAQCAGGKDTVRIPRKARNNTLERSIWTALTCAYTLHRMSTRPSFLYIAFFHIIRWRLRLACDPTNLSSKFVSDNTCMCQSLWRWNIEWDAKSFVQTAPLLLYTGSNYDRNEWFIRRFSLWFSLQA